MKKITKCKLHPKYKAIRPPRNTDKHPEGCIICWGLFVVKNNKQNILKSENKAKD